MIQESQKDLPLEQLHPYVQVYAILSPQSSDYSLLGHGYLVLLADDQPGSQPAHYLQVVRENGLILLRSRLRPSVEYERQKDTVVAWRDEELQDQQQLAISFEEEFQADFFWRLMCDKLGTDHLNINPQALIEMPNESNLTLILDQLKISKETLEYHLLHSCAFLEALHQAFQRCLSKNDQVGLRIIHSIMKIISKDMDHRLVEVIFGDPFFEMILYLNMLFLRPIIAGKSMDLKVDYPEMWKQQFSLNNRFCLPEFLIKKIKIVHKIQFYRQNLLDVGKEPYLNYILMLTQSQTAKSVVRLLLEQNLLEIIVGFKQPISFSLAQKDCAMIGQDTSESEIQVLAVKRLHEDKLRFLTEALILVGSSDQLQLKQKMIDGLYKPSIMQFLTACLDSNVVQVVGLLLCMARADPEKLLLFLREDLTQSEDVGCQSLTVKLSKKYCSCIETYENTILQIFSTLHLSIKNKQNPHPIMITFYSYILHNFKDSRSILTFLQEALSHNTIHSNLVVSQMLTQNILEKMMLGLNLDKTTSVKAIKIIKQIVSFNKQKGSIQDDLLKKLNLSALKSNFFKNCLQLLQKNMKRNNLISSMMLQVLLTIKNKKIDIFLEYILQNRSIFPSASCRVIEKKGEDDGESYNGYECLRKKVKQC